MALFGVVAIFDSLRVGIGWGAEVRSRATSRSRSA